MIPVALAALRVYLAFALPGVFAAPLLRRAFPRLRDGGASIARPAGWALIAGAGSGLTVKVAALLMTLPAELRTTTANCAPLSEVVSAGVV